mgnify:CR=1 FL=1
MARGTHLRNEPLAIAKGAVDPLGVEVCDLKLNAGDALFFENRIFHTAAPNLSDRVSKVLMYGYAYRWMKPEVISRASRQTMARNSGPRERSAVGRIPGRGYAALGAAKLGQTPWSSSSGRAVDGGGVKDFIHYWSGSGYLGKSGVRGHPHYPRFVPYSTSLDMRIHAWRSHRVMTCRNARTGAVRAPRWE